MKKLSKELRNRLWLLVAGLGIVAVILTGLVMQPLFAKDHPQVVQEVEQGVAAFYPNESQLIPDLDLDLGQLNQLIDLANQLQEDDNQDLKAQVLHLSLKARDINMLQQIYRSLALGQDEESQEQLKPGVTLETLSQVQTQQAYLIEDDFKALVDGKLSQATQVLNAHQESDRQVNQFYDLLEGYEEEAELIQVWQELETTHRLMAYHPQGQAVMDQIEEAAVDMANLMWEAHANGRLSQEDYDQINQCQTIMQYLANTEIDQRRLISLTFDDGPNQEFTPQLLDLLKEHQVTATFFVMGAYVDDHPEIAKRIVDEGHLIGNHTYSHPRLSDSTDEEVIQQLEWAQESIMDATGVDTDLFRMPFGAGGRRVVQLASDWTSIIWNLDSMDWALQDKQAILDRIYERLEPQTLLLMHDTHQATIDVMRELIPELKERGYQFVGPTEVGFDHRYFEE